MGSHRIAIPRSAQPSSSARITSDDQAPAPPRLQVSSGRSGRCRQASVQQGLRGCGMVYFSEVDALVGVGNVDDLRCKGGQRAEKEGG